MSINNERWDPLFSARAEYVDEVKLCPSTYSALAEKKRPHYPLLIVFFQCFPNLAKQCPAHSRRSAKPQHTKHNSHYLHSCQAQTTTTVDARNVFPPKPQHSFPPFWFFRKARLHPCFFNNDRFFVWCRICLYKHLPENHLQTFFGTLSLIKHQEIM